MTRRLAYPVLLLAAWLASGATGATGAAGAQGSTVAGSPRGGPDLVLPGVEVLLRDSLHLLRGKRVGLITNHSGRDRAGVRTIDLLARAPGVTLAAIFGPEHGLAGVARDGARIASGRDSATGVPVHSLYGERLAPTAAMLAELDALVYDVQDVGTRAYTFVWTMTLAAEAAGRAGIPFVVLDRPDPIRADVVEGALMRPAHRSFVGLHPVPARYGLTPGELLRHLVGTGRVRATAVVVPMSGYRRSMWWEATALPWVSPSPNVRDVEAALLYPGIVFFEATNVSEGRGTPTPFRVVGAPWLTDVGAIARELNARRLPGVRFDSTARTIARGERFGGLTIPMIAIRVTSRDSLRALDVGAHMLRAIYARHPRQWRWKGQGIEELSGSRALRRAVERGGMDRLLRDWRAEAERFRTESAPYHLYPP